MKDRFVLFAFVAFAAVIAGIVSILNQSPASAQRDAAVRWEYAALTGSYSPYSTENPSIVATAAVNICYMQADGCRNEEIRAEVNYSKFFQDSRLENTERSRTLAERRAAETAIAKAIAKLGQDGWEMASTPELQFDNYVSSGPNSFRVEQGDKQRGPDIYFKRAR
jgi:hypothetical protein